MQKANFTSAIGIGAEGAMPPNKAETQGGNFPYLHFFSEDKTRRSNRFLRPTGVKKNAEKSESWCEGVGFPTK